MASSRHNEHLKQFFKSHKDDRSLTPRHNSEKTNNSPKKSEHPSTRKVRYSVLEDGDHKASSSHHSRTHNAPKRTQVSTSRPLYRPKPPTKVAKPTADGLPEEILRFIFSLLNPNNLLVCARVCRRWFDLSNDNIIWEKVHQRYVLNSKRGQTSKITHPRHPPPGYWKSHCVKRCSDIRNKTALTSLKKIHPFTGLPTNTEKTLKSSGVRWSLCLLDNDSKDHYVTNRDVYYFSMSACIRWYGLELPPVGRIKKLKLYAANPVFYDMVGGPQPNSPCQRSLLYEMDFNLPQITATQPVVAMDASVSIYLLPNHTLLALFKDGGEVAFITTCLHYNYLVPRCLLGCADSPYLTPQHVAQADDLDPKRGLHGYGCTVELRNQRNSFYSQQFRELYTHPEDIEAGYARLRLIKEESSYEHSPVGKKISFPWKTDLFKGIVENVCFLDLTLLEESGAPMWGFSQPVKVKTPDLSDVVYDYDGDHFYIDYNDTNGKVRVKLVWEEEIGQYIIMTLDVFLNLKFINEWFSTSYK